MLPDSTVVNKVVPKNAFYKHFEVSTSMKEHFVDDIERIVWANKLAPSTLNVNSGKNVQEIAVFNVQMKRMDCPMDVFVFIDKNLPRHTVFILTFETKCRLVVNYKEAITGNSQMSFRVTKTYSTPWKSEDELSIPVQGATMDSIYENIVRAVAGTSIVEEGSSLKEDIEISNERDSLMKEINTLKTKLKIERQPQKKFLLHKEIVELEKKLK